MLRTTLAVNDASAKPLARTRRRQARLCHVRSTRGILQAMQPEELRTMIDPHGVCDSGKVWDEPRSMCEAQLGKTNPLRYRMALETIRRLCNWEPATWKSSPRIGFVPNHTSAEGWSR